VHVLLAHLQRGTVRVRRDAPIDTGTVVGLVGNSGNSNEPHLHIHAQRPAPAGGEPLSGDPLPMRFDGRYLVRNDRVSAVAE
jgi:murein DD-endopeptidase MepM/ murein hydrolase activator NlpD